MNHTMPIIKLEVERLKYTMCAALEKHATQMDSVIQEAVEAYCTPDNIAAVVHKAATKALDCAIKEEVDRFFNYGDGRKAVAQAVKESILSNKTHTILDD